MGGAKERSVGVEEGWGELKIRGGNQANILEDLESPGGLAIQKKDNGSVC